MNCLAKWAAIFFLLEELLFDKVIGWFGAVNASFPERRLMVLFSLMGRRLIGHDVISFRYSSLLFLSFSFLICLTFKAIYGLVEFCVIRMSCCRIRSRER